MNERCLLCKCTHKDASAVLKSIERSGDQQDRILQSRVQAQVMLHIRYGRLGGGGSIAGRIRAWLRHWGAMDTPCLVCENSF